MQTHSGAIFFFLSPDSPHLSSCRHKKSGVGNSVLWEYYIAVQEVVVKFFSKHCWFRSIKNHCWLWWICSGFNTLVSRTSHLLFYWTMVISWTGSSQLLEHYLLPGFQRTNSVAHVKWLKTFSASSSNLLLHCCEGYDLHKRSFAERQNKCIYLWGFAYTAEYPQLCGELTVLPFRHRGDKAVSMDSTNRSDIFVMQKMPPIGRKKAVAFVLLADTWDASVISFELLLEKWNITSRKRRGLKAARLILEPAFLI